MTSKSYDVATEGAVTVETSSGDIFIEGCDAPVVTVSDSDRINVSGGANELMVRSASKKVKLSMPAQCTLTVRTASGDIQVKGLDGGVDAKTMSGDMSLMQVKGDLNLSAISGDVHVNEVSTNDLKVQTVSGDCSVEISLFEEGHYTFHTISGDVTLHLPATQTCTVDFATWSGDLRCKLPHEMVKKEQRHKVAEVNGGGVPVEVHSTSGGVRLVVGDTAPAEAAPVKERQTDAEPSPFDLDDPVFEPESEPETVKGDTKPLSDQPFVPDYDPETEETLSEAQQRMVVLKAIEEGELSVSEGLAKLNALG